MIHVSRLFRTYFIVTTVCAASLSVLTAGCGDKKAAEAPVATGAASTIPAGASQGKVTTGADPDKAPSYPNMYGKPAGSK